MEELSFWVGIIASAAFAITGVLAISDRVVYFLREINITGTLRFQ